PGGLSQSSDLEIEVYLFLTLCCRWCDYRETFSAMEHRDCLASRLPRSRSVRCESSLLPRSLTNRNNIATIWTTRSADTELAARFASSCLRVNFFFSLALTAVPSESINDPLSQSEPGSRMKPSCKRLHRQEKGYDPTPLSSTLNGSRSGRHFFPRFGT